MEHLLRHPELMPSNQELHASSGAFCRSLLQQKFTKGKVMLLLLRLDISERPRLFGKWFHQSQKPPRKSQLRFLYKKIIRSKAFCQHHHIMRVFVKVVGHPAARIDVDAGWQAWRKDMQNKCWNPSWCSMLSQVAMSPQSQEWMKPRAVILQPARENHWGAFKPERQIFDKLNQRWGFQPSNWSCELNYQVCW